MKGSGKFLGVWIKSPNQSTTKVPRLTTGSLGSGSNTVLFCAEGEERGVKHPSVLSDGGKAKKQTEVPKLIYELPMGTSPLMFTCFYENSYNPTLKSMDT